MKKEEDSFFTETKNQLEDYIQDRLLLIKLQTAEKTARLAGILIALLVIALLGFFVLLFISIMGGYYFATLTGSMFYGFGIVAAFYLLLLLVIIKYRVKLIENKVSNTIIKTFFEKAEETES